MSLLAFRATLVHSGNSNTAGTRKLVRALSSITAVTWTSKKKKKKKKNETLTDHLFSLAVSAFKYHILQQNIPRPRLRLRTLASTSEHSNASQTHVHTRRQTHASG